MNNTRILINLHGLVIQCEAPSQRFGTRLTRPFELFLADGGSVDVTVLINETPLPYERFPELEASFSTPRNIIYDTKSLKIIDYFGKGATVEDKPNRTYTIYGTDPNLLQEAFYLLVLSIFGQYCDRNRMLRIHALALSHNDKAFLIPLPSGGGKSTMAMAMLKENDFKLISDDEPVVSSSGSVLPFVLRIGTLNQETLQGIPDEFIYSIDRMEFGLKYFIDAKYWKDQLESDELDEVIYVVAQRLLNGKPAVYPIPKYKALKSLVRDAVIGVGLYQGLEFMFAHSPWTTVSQIKLVLGRSVTALKLLRKARTYKIVLARDVDENRRVLSEFMRSLD